MKWIRYFAFLFFILLLPYSGALPLSAPRRELPFERERHSTGARPVILNLRQIRQRAEQPEEFIKHPFEIEAEEALERPKTRLPLRFTSVHNAEVDATASELPNSPALSTAIEAPTLLRHFSGIPAPGHVQPDNTIAAGPTRIIMAVNSSFAIYTKTGARRFETSFAEWFASLNISTTNLFDPRVLYDQYSKHFIFMCDARRSDGRSWYLFSVSKTSDPESDWAFWALEMSLNGNTYVNLWADFPRIGVDNNAIYLTGNMTDFITIKYHYAKLRILKKSEVYSFGDIHWQDFWKLKDPNGDYAFDITPAHSFGSAPVEYAVSTNLAQGDTATLWSITDGGTDNPVVHKQAVGVSTYGIAPTCAQKGGGNTTNPGTPNPVNVVYRGGSIYTAITVSYNWGSGDVAAVRFYRISTDGTLLQEITFGADGFYYFFPAVMPDSKGNLYLVFNRSSASQFIGIYYSGRRVDAPAGKFSKSVRLQGGLVNYENPYEGSNLNRWGDYNGIAKDPGGSVWIFSEYPLETAIYATTVGRLKYPAQ